MNTRKFILAALMTQMISLPILLTVEFLVMVENLPLIPRIRGLGPDTSNLIFLLIYFLSTLFVGGIVGFLFSWRFKHKPDTPKACYLPLIFPIVYALIFATLAVLFAGFDYTSEWWGAYLLKNPAFLILELFTSLEGNRFLFPGMEILAYTGFLIGVLFQEFISSEFPKPARPSRSFKVTLALICITAVISFGMFTQNVVQYGISF